MRKPLPNIDTLIDNILSVYAQATNEDIRNGRAWYDGARAYCAYLSGRYNVPFQTTCSVIACLSPNTKWESNKRDCERMLSAHHSGLDVTQFNVTTYTRNKLKAWNIIKTNNISLLTGRKVTAFAHNIAFPDSDKVTVDFRAYNIAMRTQHTIDTIPTFTDRLFQHIAYSYKVSARLQGEYPAHLQAITWIVNRNMGVK